MKRNWVKFGAAAVLIYFLLHKQKPVPFFVTQSIPSGLVSPPIPIGFGY